MEAKYNMRSPAVKRLMREAKELCEPTEEFFAQPLEDNLFEWHFTVGGAPETDFENGLYHGRIILPAEYPMKPPSIILLTPNGRFEVNKKICLSISGHHPESWQPSWSIRTALLAIIGFMPTPGNGAIGSLDYKPDERKLLAKRSLEWNCPVCGSIRNSLAKRTQNSSANEEAMQLAAQISFKGENEQSATSTDSSTRVTPSEAPIMSPGAGGMPFSPLLSNPVSIALPSSGAAAIPVSVPSMPMRVGLQPDSGDAVVPLPNTSASSKPDLKADSADSSHSCASAEKNESLRRRSNITAAQPSTSNAIRATTNVNASTTAAANGTPRSTVILVVLISIAIFALLFRRLFLL